MEEIQASRFCNLGIQIANCCPLFHGCARACANRRPFTESAVESAFPDRFHHCTGSNGWHLTSLPLAAPICSRISEALISTFSPGMRKNGVVSPMGSRRTYRRTSTPFSAKPSPDAGFQRQSPRQRGGQIVELLPRSRSHNQRCNKRNFHSPLPPPQPQKRVCAHQAKQRAPGR